MVNLDVTQLVNTTTKPLVCIQTFKTGEDGLLSLENILNEMRPGYVIMYHCNISAIRQIEVYESGMKRSARDRLKVFFLMHSQTVEEQSYLTNLRREKLAFDLLIDTKAVSLCQRQTMDFKDLHWFPFAYRKWLFLSIKMVNQTIVC